MRPCFLLARERCVGERQSFLQYRQITKLVGQNKD